jgi:hypothetical protein
MKTISLTIKKNKATAYDCWEVKNGRKIHAKIYLVRKGENAGFYQIEVNGCAFYRASLEDSKAFLFESYEYFLNMIRNEYKVEIVEK